MLVTSSGWRLADINFFVTNVTKCLQPINFLESDMLSLVVGRARLLRGTIANTGKRPDQLASGAGSMCDVSKLRAKIGASNQRHIKAGL